MFFFLLQPKDLKTLKRRWMIVKEGRHLSQRVLPTMALIQPKIVPNGLLLSAPNMSDLFVPVDPLPNEKYSCS